MKQIFTVFIILLILNACNNKTKSSEIATYSINSQIQLNDTLRGRIGSWIKEGMECYGIVSIIDKNGKIISASPIRAQVLIIHPNEVKMKALETVSFGKVIDCTKMSITKGDTWWEKEGDLFRDKAQAFNFLTEDKGLRLLEKQ